MTYRIKGRFVSDFKVDRLEVDNVVGGGHLGEGPVHVQLCIPELHGLEESQKINPSDPLEV